jgi:hypothetical protein
MVTQPLWFKTALGYAVDVGDQFGSLTWTEKEDRCRDLRRRKPRSTSET